MRNIAAKLEWWDVVNDRTAGGSGSHSHLQRRCDRRPPDYPTDAYSKYGQHTTGLKPLSDEDLDDRYERRRQFDQAWLAVRHRYRACSDRNGELERWPQGLKLHERSSGAWHVLVYHHEAIVRFN
jgi:hypothetical protein